jgi:hypothetical protein
LRRKSDLSRTNIDRCRGKKWSKYDGPEKESKVEEAAYPLPPSLVGGRERTLAQRAVLQPTVANGAK